MPKHLAECEHVSLDARSAKGYLEGAVANRSPLANQLIKALLLDRPGAQFIDIESMSLARRFTIEEHLERHRRPTRKRAHYKVDVARMEAEEDSPTGAVEHARPRLECPIPCEGPMVQL
jgi:hypothetical protein